MVSNKHDSSQISTLWKSKCALTSSEHKTKMPSNWSWPSNQQTTLSAMQWCLDQPYTFVCFRSLLYRSFSFVTSLNCSDCLSIICWYLCTESPIIVILSLKFYKNIFNTNIKLFTAIVFTILHCKIHSQTRNSINIWA